MFRDLPTTNVASLKQDIIFYHYMHGDMKYLVHKKLLLMNKKTYEKDDGTFLEIPGLDGKTYKVVRPNSWTDAIKQLG